jgi:glucosylceramidase
MHTRLHSRRPRVAHAMTVVGVVLLGAATPGSPPLAAPTTFDAGQVDAWMTTADRSQLLSPQPATHFLEGGTGAATTITVDPGQVHQTMTGFGASFTDSSAWLISNSPHRDSIMTRLFDPKQGIGLSMVRQPIGASDFARSSYTYDDVPGGQTDSSLTRFSIAHDEAYVLPLLRRAREINPQTTFLASPWSAPAWMKTSGELIGGSLKREYYQAYANYFVKFLRAYQDAGVPISLVTPQNEPEFSPANYPGMLMSAQDQADFIGGALGPAIANAGLGTGILAFDHNWDRPGYPIDVLRDSGASRYTAGSAFHCYGGEPDAQTNVHNAFPGKDIHFTECSGIRTGDDARTFADTLSWQTRNLVIGATRNWAKSVVLWNLALDQNGGPTMNCTTCTGVTTVRSDGTVSYNAEYYVLGHISKFVKPGAVRIGSNTFGQGNIEDVAFRNQDGSTVLVVHNNATGARAFDVASTGRHFSTSLPAGAVATFTWSGSAPPGGGESTVDRTGWRVTASSTPADPCCTGDSAAKAIDGNPSTRWSTGLGQQSGQWYQIDLGTSRKLTKIVMENGGSTGDHPRGYAVHASDNASTWGNPIATGQGNDPTTTIQLPTTTARYLRITQTGNAGNWWSISELNLYEPAGGTA